MNNMALPTIPSLVSFEIKEKKQRRRRSNEKDVYESKRRTEDVDAMLEEKCKQESIQSDEFLVSAKCH